MKRILLFTTLVGIIGLTYAQNVFTELPDHKGAVAQEWKGVKGTNAAWGTSDVRYAWHSLPDINTLKHSETLIAWLGERVSTQAIIYSSKATDSLTLQLTPFRNGRNTLPVGAVKAAFVRYVKTDSWSTPDGRGAGCGHRPDHTIYDSATFASSLSPQRVSSRCGGRT